ncbi:replicative DNA helicase [Paraburkholderia sp. C35]|uniref:replicative DNA helicase n=1 Tax=Paraburkholderia sp. C35 TaxID=2126993 RepID=UPI000D686056|nr:replicative DNA helicase [Paraburkholderia sp. C35]
MNAPHEFDDSGLRTPPHSLEMEQSVLGALMLDNDAFDELRGLRAEHFYRYEHRVIFDVITKLIAATRTADVMTVYERLQSDGRVDQTGGLAYLNKLFSNTPSAANIGRYAEIVIDRWKLRGIITAADEVSAMAFTRNGKEVDEIIGEAQSRLEELADLSSDAPKLASESLPAYLEKLDAQYHSGNSQKTSISTGLKALDWRLDGGMRGGELIVVAGRPAMGKTGFAMGIADHVGTELGLPVAVFSLEMPTEQLNMRTLARLSGLPISKLRDGSKLDDADWPYLTSAVQHMTETQIFVDESGYVSLGDIVSRSRAIKRRHGLGLVVIDYLQLIQLGSEERHDLKIGAVTRGLKLLAKQLGVPVMLLSQLNRKLEERPNKRPMVSDLRDSGTIEQDADIIVLLYRDEVYHEDTSDKGVAEAIVAKQRNGALGTAHLEFIAEQAKFGNLSGGYIPTPRTKPRASRGFDE